MLSCENLLHSQTCSHLAYVPRCAADLDFEGDVSEVDQHTPGRDRLCSRRRGTCITKWVTSKSVSTTRGEFGQHDATCYEQELS